MCCSVLQCVAASKCNKLYCYNIPRRGLYYVPSLPRQVCCSVLQCVAACWSVLQYVAVCCSVLQCVAVCCSNRLYCYNIPRRGLYYIYCIPRQVCWSMLQYVAVCCTVTGCTVTIFHVGVYITFNIYRARCVAACCSVLQCIAVCCCYDSPRRGVQYGYCIPHQMCCSVLQRVAMSKCNRLYCYKIPRRGI